VGTVGFLVHMCGFWQNFELGTRRFLPWGAAASLSRQRELPEKQCRP